jgi:hypothetical protein
MRQLDLLLDEVYRGQERVSRDELYRRAVAEDSPVGVLDALDALPAGDYSQDEVAEALAYADDEPADGTSTGIAPDRLDETDLFRELGQLYRTRLDTLRHGPDHALTNHNDRMAELETEYLRRFPERETSRGAPDGHTRASARH